MPTLSEILAHEEARLIVKAVDKAGYAGRYGDWYAGITNDLDVRFAAHGVSPETPFYYVETSSRRVAGAAEQYLLDLGFDGDTGGGADAHIVYVFLKWPAFARERDALHAQQQKEARVRRVAEVLRGNSPHTNVTGPHRDLFRHNG